MVFRLEGASPASAGLQVPKSRSDSLAAPGRFLYILMHLTPGKAYALYADFLTADRTLHRLTVSNQFKAAEQARMRHTGVHVYLEVSDEAWTLLAVDMQAMAQQATSQAPYAHLKSLALCAIMTVRGAFTSDLKYNWDALPADLDFTGTFDTSAARVVWVPGEPAQGTRLAVPARKSSAPLPPVPRAAAAGPRRQRQPLAPSNSAAGARCQPVSLAGPPPVSAAVPPPAMHPDPIVVLERISAFSGWCQQPVVWVPGSSEVVFAAGPTVVAMQPNGVQRRLQGHAQPVVELAHSSDGSVVASAEQGSGGLVRVWNFREGRELAAIKACAGTIISLALNQDGSALLTAGVDGTGKQLLAWWDVAACRSGGPAKEVARHQSDYSITAVTFVPCQPDSVVTCGKNSVRIYR